VDVEGVASRLFRPEGGVGVRQEKPAERLAVLEAQDVAGPGVGFVDGLPGERRGIPDSPAGGLEPFGLLPEDVEQELFFRFRRDPDLRHGPFRFRRRG
jgi:hypothetical protein